MASQPNNPPTPSDTQWTSQQPPTNTSRNHSRRSSSQQNMGPPPVPASPSQATHLHTLGSPSLRTRTPSAGPSSPTTVNLGMALGRGDHGGIEQGPGPLRHPRPLTPAELYWQVEKEGEAVVNRLTRELTQLRQHSASVASSTSSATSASMLENAPVVARTRRSSSSTSAQGRPVGSVIVPGAATVGHGLGSIPITTPSQASIERAREGGVMSRQNSITSTRRSRASSPAHQPSSWAPAVDHHHPQQPRQAMPSPHYHVHPYQHHHVPHAPLPLTASSPTSSGFMTARLEETAMHRAEMEAAKRENEALKKRIRELERVMSARRQSSASAGGEVADKSHEGGSTSEKAKDQGKSGDVGMKEEERGKETAKEKENEL
ncbi:MAG: hypothetical protein M1823_000218 [Watsoniomyces obsoletus]|nr:MAG: hypothetical protein M1823_000218 [Watsoniomyces obsoletus]